RDQADGFAGRPALLPGEDITAVLDAQPLDPDLVAQRDDLLAGLQVVIGAALADVHLGVGDCAGGSDLLLTLLLVGTDDRCLRNGRLDLLEEPRHLRLYGRVGHALLGDEDDLGLLAGAVTEAVLLQDIERRLCLGALQPLEIIAESGADHLSGDEQDDDEGDPAPEYRPTVAVIETCESL